VLNDLNIKISKKYIIIIIQSKNKLLQLKKKCMLNIKKIYQEKTSSINL
jgi:hypothetical protein